MILNDDTIFEGENEEDWKHVSQDVKALVAKLLEKDPKKRGNLDQVTATSWKISNKSDARIKLRINVTVSKIYHQSLASINKGSYKINSQNSKNNNIFKKYNSTACLPGFSLHLNKQKKSVQRVADDIVLFIFFLIFFF